VDDEGGCTSREGATRIATDKAVVFIGAVSNEIRVAFAVESEPPVVVFVFSPLGWVKVKRCRIIEPLRLSPAPKKRTLRGSTTA
jgi:hypothetical protein